MASASRQDKSTTFTSSRASSFGASRCDAKSIPERLFMVAAEAVAKSLSAEEVALDRVVPHPIEFASAPFRRDRERPRGAAARLMRVIHSARPKRRSRPSCSR